jgi:hypothetical protein
MHFYNKRTPHPKPSLTLCHTEVPVVNETNFLGIIFDSKLTLKPHIVNLNKKCLKAMNLLRVVAHMDWGADSTLHDFAETLPLCGEIEIRLRLCCLWIGKDFLNYLESLDLVQNAALRVCLGAF